MEHSIFIIVLMILASWITAEAIKFIVDFGINKRADIRVLLGYGGFPSAHSALVSSLCTSILLVQGISISFLISAVLASIVLRDTITIRRYIDKNTERIAQLSNHLSKDEMEIEYISHSILEIIVGVTLGIVIPVVIYMILL
jgi:uncharacterized protein